MRNQLLPMLLHLHQYCEERWGPTKQLKCAPFEEEHAARQNTTQE